MYRDCFPAEGSSTLPQAHQAFQRVGVPVSLKPEGPPWQQGRAANHARLRCT